MTSDITIQLVQPQHINWGIELAAPLLDKGLVRQKVRDKYPLKHCLQLCANGQAQLWLVWKGKKLTAAVMTLVKDYPGGGSYLDIFIVGGWKIALWAQQAFDELVGYAKAAGCSTLSAGGRLGWNRLAKKYGDKVTTYSQIAIDLR